MTLGGEMKGGKKGNHHREGSSRVHQLHVLSTSNTMLRDAVSETRHTGILSQEFCKRNLRIQVLSQHDLWRSFGSRPQELNYGPQIPTYGGHECILDGGHCKVQTLQYKSPEQ